MGFFDFFKKKTNNEPPKNQLFLSVSKYNEYIIRFITMQQQGNYAPISAYEKANGELVGFLYILGEDADIYSLSAADVVQKMEANFEQKMRSKEIKSYVILYHSQFAHDGNHAIADADEELKAITVAYHFDNQLKGKIALSYTFGEEKITYQGFSDFNQRENNQIFATQLKADFDYFQERELIVAPSQENAIGLTIRKANTKNLHNMWGGIFGFALHNSGDTEAQFSQQFAATIAQQPIHQQGNLKAFQQDFGDILFKSIAIDNQPITFFPVVKTDYSIPIENFTITEWENVDGLEAIIKAQGRDTYGLEYFATDYAENKHKYLSEKRHNIKISGIAFVVDIYQPNPNDTVNYSEDFTAYLPSSQLPNYACFNFVGQVQDAKPTSCAGDASIQGYIMNVQLITANEDKNFFTIDIFVNPENMRFDGLKKGMKITGLVQFQGQIAS